MLKPCAIKNVVVYFAFSFVKICLKSVSRPILTNATENNISLKPFAVLPTLLAVSGSNSKLNTRDAKINPKTNFGNLSHNKPESILFL